MWVSPFFLLAVVAASNAQTATEVSQCLNNPGPLPIFTEVVNCVTPPCRMPQEQDAVLNIVFQAPSNIRKMETLVTAYLPPLPIIGEIGYQYPLEENAVTCNFLTNSYCPVMQGEILQYQLRMFILEMFPVNTQVTLEFRIVDTDGQSPLVCIRVPIRIDPPLSPAVGKMLNSTMVDSEQ